jgi:site-specific recombinase XerD
MQTTSDILTMYAKNLELRGILEHTQQFYLRVARKFLEWLNRSGEEMKEDDINAYLLHLEKSKNLKSSTLSVRKAVLRLLFGAITGESEFCPPLRFQPIRNGYLKDDKKSFIRYLTDMQYAEKNLDNYKWTLNRLERFMSEQNQPAYSRNIGEKFLFYINYKPKLINKRAKFHQDFRE